ncbi:MAG: spermidine synthase [Oceanicoccus sp.]|jgi:spermidine synthase
MSSKDCASHPLWRVGPHAGELVDKAGTLEVREIANVRWLHRGNGAIESAMNLANPSQLMLAHNQALSLFRIFNKSPNRILNLGLGGGDLIRYLTKISPSTAITTVEQDPNVIAFYFQHFSQASTQHEIIEANALTLEDILPGRQQFNAIIIDIFNEDSFCSLGLNRQYLERCFSWLSDDGVIGFNLMVKDVSKLQQLASNLRNVTGSIPVIFGIPHHLNIIVFVKRDLPVYLDAISLIKEAENLDKTDITQLPIMKKIAQRMIEDNKSRFEAID